MMKTRVAAILIAEEGFVEEQDRSQKIGIDMWLILIDRANYFYTWRQ